MLARVGSRFAKQLELASEGAGRYAVDISDDWNCPFVPHGGVVTAVAGRAMERELARPDQPLRSISVCFAGQVRPGPASIQVRVLRRGRSMSQVVADVISAGDDAGLHAMAVFGAERPGFEFTDLSAPDVAGPEGLPHFRDPRPDGGDDLVHFNFWDQADGRPATGHAPWEDYVPTTSEHCNWLRFDEPSLRADGSWDPLAVVALCDTMPGAVFERMGRNVPPFFPPSADLTVHLLGEARGDYLLVRNRARHAGDGYASLENEMWDTRAGLVAYATQVMFFSFPDGPPSPEQRRPPSPGD
jgi:acyl-CoA thioesterase